jgi:hypothetical protein
VDQNILQLIIMGLAVFRITHLIVYDKITEFLRAPFFDEQEEMDENGEQVIFLVPKTEGMKGWIGELLSCHWCTGIWVAAGSYFLYSIAPGVASPLISIMAIAGLASLLEAVVQRWLL